VSKTEIAQAELESPLCHLLLSILDAQSSNGVSLINPKPWFLGFQH
jgi:hypothetical protein